MKFIYLFIGFLLIYSVSGAVVTNSFTAEGTGSVGRNLDLNWQSGMDSEFVGGSAGSLLLTAPGAFQYQTSDKVDATTNNRYNETGYVRFDNGGVGSESASMYDSYPNQQASVTHDYILQTTEIDTAKFVSDANMSIGQQAAWDGAGLYTRDASYSVEITRESNDSTMHYRTDSSDHGIISTNMTGGARVRPQFSYIDFSDAFIFNQTGVNSTMNQTANESVNLT